MNQCQCCPLISDNKADIKCIFLQLLTVHLNESDSFAAWRTAKEANLEENGEAKGALIVL